jgi:hypothetical protein
MQEKVSFSEEEAFLTQVPRADEGGQQLPFFNRIVLATKIVKTKEASDKVLIGLIVILLIIAGYFFYQYMSLTSTPVPTRTTPSPKSKVSPKA